MAKTFFAPRPRSADHNQFRVGVRNGGEQHT
jgi:hypothetical protein